MVKPQRGKIAPKPSVPSPQADSWVTSGGLDPEIQAPPPAIASPTPPAETPKKGRAKGKRSDPNYVQVGAYIPVAIDKQVKRLLLDEDIDFSELVAQLLEEWISDKSLN